MVCSSSTGSTRKGKKHHHSNKCPNSFVSRVPEIKQQVVFTIDEFPNRLLKKSKDLFGEVVEQLEEQFR